MSARVIHGRCEEALRDIQDSSIECIVTDPPYGLSESPDPLEVMKAWVSGEDYHHRKPGFMNAEWDAFVPQPSAWKEALRVLKPGGYALVFAGSRTQDWMAMSLRVAGFEVVDTIMWVYAQGMPKSHNISKAIDKLVGAERQRIPTGDPVSRMVPGWSQVKTGSWIKDAKSQYQPGIEIPGSEDAAKWNGWGTQLKPAYEPILVCRKPIEKTFAKNVLKHGVGGINIDACRIPVDAAADASQLRVMNRGARAGDSNDQAWGYSKGGGDQPPVVRPEGRWPANLAHDGSDEVLDQFPGAPGAKADVTGCEPSCAKQGVNTFNPMDRRHFSPARGDAGSAARFFFCAKPSSKERHLGMDHPGVRFPHGSTLRNIEDAEKRGNHHPTLKPIKLMRWLVRLVCPPGGTVLDMYCGSGTTGFAAIEEGFSFIGIERDAKYASIATARCAYAEQMMSGLPSKRKQRRRAARKAGRFLKGDQIPLFEDDPIYA